MKIENDEFFVSSHSLLIYSLKYTHLVWKSYFKFMVIVEIKEKVSVCALSKIKLENQFVFKYV